jgi:hypothetical protein
MDMRSLIVGFAFALSLLTLLGSAQAACYGSGSFQTCYDNSGNSYTVNQYGNQTQMNGYNANTGSQWSQTTNTMGNTTYSNGQTNGQQWNMIQQNYGGMQTYSGSNSSGQPFYYTCTQVGGCY